MKNKFFETELRDTTCIVWFDQEDSKVNKISPDVIDLFVPLLDEINNSKQIQSAILISRKKDFIAGADIESFDQVRQPGDWQPIAARAHAALRRIEESRKPIVAALHGACMGAGTEIALACAARIAADDGTVIALPEVKLGLLPGAGGTQRLTQLVGIERALDMMLTGKNVYAYPAKKMGLVDRLSSRPALLDAALCLARELVDRPLRRPDTRPWLSRLLESTPWTRRIIFSQAKKAVDRQTKGNMPAPHEIINCVRAGSERGASAGYAEEIAGFEKLMLSPESRQLRNVFFSMTEKKKNPLATMTKPIRRVGILGAGFMGAGIAEVTITNDIAVVLKDLQSENISRAKKTIWKSLQQKVERKAISRWEADTQLSRISGQFDYAHFQQVDLVIEAVFEDLQVKRDVLADCEEHLSDQAIFASNTSALPISDIAANSSRPDRVIGMHYFSPVPKMPLLEIVQAKHTADWVVATCYDMGIKQGKTVIVVQDGPGFYTTRVLAPMMGEALNLLDEGADVLQVDRALTRFGFPVGPFTLMDEVGLDVCAHIMSGKLIQHFQATRQDMLLSSGLSRMYSAGFQGRKNRRGFYQYDDQGKKLSGKVNSDIYGFFNRSHARPIDSQQITERIAWSFISEAVRCLEETVISSPLDGDVGAIFGLGFPPQLGGPFRYMDSLGTQSAVDLLKRLADNHGRRFLPPQILLDTANAGRAFYVS